MKPVTASLLFNHKMMGLFFSLTILALAVSGCNSAPESPTPAPTIDTTALVNQISQTLEAKMTQQAAQIPTAQPIATLLPTAVALTSAPTPTLPPVQPTFLLPTLLPSPSAALPVTTPAAAAVPPALFAVIHVVTDVNHADLSASCPPGFTFNFTGSITTNGPGTVTYYWEFSDNSKTDTKTLTFDSASTQNVNTDWTLGSSGKTPGSNPYKGWARVTIVQPNNQVFPRTSINFECK
jgi:hypothetical protein